MDNIYNDNTDNNNSKGISRQNNNIKYKIYNENNDNNSNKDNHIRE